VFYFSDKYKITFMIILLGPWNSPNFVVQAGSHLQFIHFLSSRHDGGMLVSSDFVLYSATGVVYTAYGTKCANWI
jgi:hypothetical protein